LTPSGLPVQQHKLFSQKKNLNGMENKFNGVYGMGHQGSGDSTDSVQEMARSMA